MPEYKITSKGSKKKMPRSTKIKIALIVILIIAIIGIGIYIAFDKWLDSKIDKINIVTKETGVYVTGEIEDPVETSVTTTEEYEEFTWDVNEKAGSADKMGLPKICDTEDVFNILIIGVDARSMKEASRNDTTILVSINKKTKEIVMASFLRDVLVSYDFIKKDANRFNCAHAYGGADYVMKMLKNDFNISVNRYVTFNFFSFVDCVEAMGGVDVEMTLGEIKDHNLVMGEVNNIYNKLYKEQGVDTRREWNTDFLPEVEDKYHLNGFQALCYARNRHTGLKKEDGTIGSPSDFARTTRQRMIINMLIDKAKELSWSELNHVIDVMLPKVTTNMDKELIKSLVKQVPVYATYNINSFNVPQSGYWKYATYNKKSIIDIDTKKCMEGLYKEIYKENP